MLEASNETYPNETENDSQVFDELHAAIDQLPDFGDDTEENEPALPETANTQSESTESSNDGSEAEAPIVDSHAEVQPEPESIENDMPLFAASRATEDVKELSTKLNEKAATAAIAPEEISEPVGQTVEVTETTKQAEPIAAVDQINEVALPSTNVETESEIEATPEANIESEANLTTEAKPESADEAEATIADSKEDVKAVEETSPAKAETKAVEDLEAQKPKAEKAKSKKAKSEKPATEATESTTQPAVDIDSDNLFANLPLSDEVKQAVAKAGYEQPTPIQAEIIPHVLSGRDVLAQSQTGSGKTAAFALPILSNIKGGPTKKPKVLVLAPTRELAIQVAKSFSTYAAQMPKFSVAAIYGGQPYEPQLKQLRRGVHVVVGTPGRVIDHVNRGTLDLSGIQCLVLDEADEMLNMGFLEDVEFVLKHAPKKRQVALFSATLPKPIRDISARYLNDPAKVTIQQKTMTADSIRQRAVFAAQREKVNILIRFLEAENADGVIVFTRTRESTTVVAEQLAKAGLSALALNGDMPQKTRERTIQRLKSGQLDIIVATDVAARGLDVPRISHVFNYDLPEGPESYIHRVGRTGRAGRTGQAIIFLSRGQQGKLRFIERVTKQPIEIVEPPTADEINKMRVTKFKNRIEKTIKEVDLTFFEKLVSEAAEQTGQPYEKIAAALAHMGQNGRHFLMKDQPRPKYKERPERSGGGGRGRSGGGPEAGMKRFRLAVGKRDGVRPGNIVGAITNEGGLQGSDIGSIRIEGSFTLIDLPENMPQHVCEILEETRVAGRALQLRPANEEDCKPPRKFHRKGRPNDRHRGGGGGGKSRSYSKGKSSNYAGKKTSNYAGKKKR